ncbi:MAG: tRNA (N(6)-L-threonylcarbamoyladenosine(37)-C(2))-methylthiotransferase MtaB [Firmicutes bacterium]|nr:tRNA (N(6)-L-threonylcarbamoyladenosine(37)-C(2))-methylthiotransferase MtaB [Bacillota bacterium]
MKFYIYTLGCKVNTYESNVMRDILLNNGYEEVTKKDEIADIYIINTCTVTNTAHQKSFKIIRHVINQNKKAIIVVVGCDAQINADIIKEINGVSIILGNKNKSKILDYINEYKENRKQIVDIYDLENQDFECMQLNNFNKTRAFVKIQDGCENFCSYCIIPYARGNVRSKDMQDVIEEITHLVKENHREIVLTGIHTGHYGSDKDYNFACLLKEIVKIEGLERLRISSIEINEITEDVLDIIKESEIIVDHIHIPMQSACDKTLKEMNRKYDCNFFINKINDIRKIRPNISITTDIIVGFPNETEEDFNQTLKTIKQINFSKIHAFPFSLRKGTKAEQMPNHLSEIVKKERVKKLIKLSKELELDYMNQFIGREVTFIPEIYKDGYLIGHTGNYLLIKYKGDVSDINKTLKVKIEKTDYPYSVAI